MSFKRKRDWPMLVYKYRAYVDPQDIPAVMWDKARDMQTTWNTMTKIWRTTLYEVGQIDKEDKSGRKARWAQCNAETKAALLASPLNDEEQRDVETRFRATIKRINVARGEKPQYQESLDHISLFHRYSGGGMPVDRLFSPRARRVSIVDPPDAVYPNGRTPSTKDKPQTITQAIFGLANGEHIAFRVRLHRPLPKAGIVKRVLWTGRRDPVNAQKWIWYLNIMLEVPHASLCPTAKGAVALDFGWRVMGEGEAIRVAYCRDDRGREFELRLNILEEKSRNKKVGIPSNYPAWMAYDEAIGNRIEACKQQLVDLLPADQRKGLDKMQQSGLRRLEARLSSAIWAGGDKAGSLACNAINDCMADLAPIERKRNALADRLTAKRRYLYQNFAAWLTQTYAEIVWEDELKIKELKSRETKKLHPALQNAGKFAQWAAPGELREIIRKATVKNATLLTGGETAGSTVICSSCAALMEASAQLIIECPSCGTAWDQDTNAARNLLKFSQTLAVSEQRNGLRKNGGHQVSVPLDIPEILQRVVHVVQQGSC